MTVIGAGPYGLSVAAHLIGNGIETRVLGEVMSFWRGHMPVGMKLRSGWRASNLSAPGGRYSLDEYVASGEMPRKEPIPLEDFVRYGQWFQRQAVGNVEERRVQSVEFRGGRFRIAMQDGETFESREVVIAAGLANQAMYPAEFQGLGNDLVSHAVDHTNLGIFRGQRVAVIGRGQSAVESAALLAESGAEVELICRGDVRWIGTESFGGATAEKGFVRSMVKRMRAPSGVGPFPMDWLADMPTAVHFFPKKLKRRVTRRCLRPAAAGWLMPRMGGVRVHGGSVVREAKAQSGRLELRLDNDARLTVDHVLLATGYTLDITKPGILAPSLVEQIELHPGTGCPVLRNNFQASVPGLHFVGSSAVPSYGPLMRFVAGAGYAARSIARGARSRQVIG